MTRDLLACDELFLLLTKDDGGRQGSGPQRGIALTTGVLADLILRGRLAAEGDRHHRVRVVDPAPTGDPVLDPALERVRQKDGSRFASLVRDTKLNPEQAVARRLAGEEIVQVRPGRLGGLLPATYPALDPAPERAVRARLVTALRSGEALPQDATVLSVLSALNLAHPVLKGDVPELSRRALTARITEVAGRSAAADAASAALKAIQAAVTAAAATAAAAAVTSSS